MHTCRVKWLELIEMGVIVKECASEGESLYRKGVFVLSFFSAGGLCANADPAKMTAVNSDKSIRLILN